MIPGVFILRLRRGDYYKKRFRFQVASTEEYYDFAGMTGIAQVRASEDAMEVLASATVTMGTDEISHYVEVFFPDSETVDLEAGTYKWDLEITDGTGRLTWLEGDVVVSKDVSRGI